jgi:hypothetical protein
MKIMTKKFQLLMCIVCFANVVHAQLRVGVQAGASVVAPRITYTGTTATFSHSGLTYVYPGLILDYQLGKAFSIRPSLNYLRLGSQLTQTLAGITSTTQTTIDNVNVPLDLVVPIKLGSGKLELMAGPTLTLAFKGTQQQSTNLLPTPTISALNFGSGSLELKRVNWGTNFGVGYRLKNGLGIRAMYNLGLTDLNNVSSSSSKFDVLTLTASYFLFGAKS